MPPLRLLPLLLGLGVAAWAAPVEGPAPTRNLFHELLGKSDAELDSRIATAWRQLFQGDDESQRVYFPVGRDLAYIADVGSGDVRTEGMSYGMMLAVQLDHRAEFDRLWRWADKYMRHHDGPRRGYFAWQCKFDGTQIDPGTASDGEEWLATALFLAARRWGSGAGILNYEAEAQALLHEMLHKPATSVAWPIFDRAAQQVVFSPNPRAGNFTDPSYHLPAFYELWARWAADASDRAFWSAAAGTSRGFFRRAAHPRTGLMPEYAHFDGTPYPGRLFGGGKDDFRFDAWRTLANVGLDYAWWHADPWEVEQSNRVLRFLQSHAPDIPNQFTLAGRPLSTDTSAGLTAMAAVAGLAADPDIARPFVQRLWDEPIPAGRWRYYDGLLYLLAYLEVGGRFQIPVSSQK